MDSCDICCDEKERNSKPKTNSKLRPFDLNEKVAIDLTKWWDEHGRSKLIICHMIDEYCILSAAKVIEDKNPEFILNTRKAKWMLSLGHQRSCCMIVEESFRIIKC